MPIDINGYALSTVASELKFGASNSRIAPANYGLRDPMLPAMTGACNTPADGTGPFNVYPYPVNDVSQLNNGGVWSTGNYRFTAPVPGLYYTSYGGIVGSSNTVSTDAYFGIIVNGALWYFSYKNTLSTWEFHHLEMTLKLAAGDSVAWAMNLAPGPVSGSPSVGAYRSNHNVCSIWLIG